MNRSKRAIKTPKRFDEEGFITPCKQPPKQPVQNTPQTPKDSSQSSNATQPTPTIQLPTPGHSDQSPKNILKVKLTSKSKPKTPIKIDLKPKIPIKTESKPKVPVKIEPKLNPEPKPKPEVKPKVEIKPKVESKPKPIVKPDPKPKPIPSKIEIKPKTPERDTPTTPLSVNRSRMKRPRTPPVFKDIVPNLALPFWDARTAAEDHEDDNVKELVHCHCDVVEELGLMIQCETCLTWQHAHCLGYETPEEVPDGYTCKSCSDPKFARESMKWAYDQEWLTKGRMRQISTDVKQDPEIEKREKLLCRINELICHILNIEKILHSLKIKRRLLSKADDENPELKAFNFPWPASYQHIDGSHFVPTINQVPGTPESTISVMGETPDPGDIAVDSVADATLPDIGHLEDVSAILDGADIVNNTSVQQIVNNNDLPPINDCRINLKLHIQQTEEFVKIELANIQEKVSQLEQELNNDDNKSLNENDLNVTLDSLKNDLHTMKRYIMGQKNKELKNSKASQ